MRKSPYASTIAAAIEKAFWNRTRTGQEFSTPGRPGPGFSTPPSALAEELIREEAPNGCLDSLSRAEIEQAVERAVDLWSSFDDHTQDLYARTFGGRDEEVRLWIEARKDATVRLDKWLARGVDEASISSLALDEGDSALSDLAWARTQRAVVSR